MDAAPSQDGYYIVEQGQKKGPLDLSVLETMRRDGGLSETTLMWRDGMADWQPARTVVPEIFSGGTVTYSIAEPGQRVLAGVIDICIVQALILLIVIFTAGLFEFGFPLANAIYGGVMMSSLWQATVGKNCSA